MGEPSCTQQSPGLSGSDSRRPEDCVSEEDLLAFVQGALGPAARAAIHQHLDHCETCQRLVSEAAHALEPSPVSENLGSAWNVMFQPGAKVAQRYVIERFVARGGMGEVYAAHDEELQDRVALKTVTATASDNHRAIRRLKAEVQLARKVSHENVCRIYDLGAHRLENSGILVSFFTMEFVDGEGLGERLRRQGPLGVSEAVRIARQLLLGLRAAHQAGILHRDFKSDNVMLRKGADGSVAPVIMDFGLARALDRDMVHLTSGTHQGLVGTLSYMSPEQLEGRELTPASDVYAFGVVWFEMLTGSLPFASRSAAANAVERLHKAPQSPSTLNPLVPDSLNRVVLGCLERDLARRYPSAESVLEALDTPASLEHRSPTAADVTLPPQRGGKGTLRRLVWIAAGIVAALWAIVAVLTLPPSRLRGAAPSTEVEPPREPVQGALNAARSERSSPSNEVGPAPPGRVSRPSELASAGRGDLHGSRLGGSRQVVRLRRAPLETPAVEPSLPSPSAATSSDGGSAAMASAEAPSEVRAKVPAEPPATPSTTGIHRRPPPDWEDPFPELTRKLRRQSSGTVTIPD